MLRGMPKNSSIDILKRWQAMDAALAGHEWFTVRRFAKKWGVSDRTVFRDLDAFRAMGQAIKCIPPASGSELLYDYRQRYEPGVRCLFHCQPLPKKGN